jgi:ParB/RepB/Spo0J family partition protein
MNAVRIAVEQLKPAPYNKRDPKSYGAKPLADLAASIKEKDILSPILVRLTDGHYQIIAGHRRYAAALLAGLKDVPCTVMDVSEAEGKEICAIENLQREDLGLMDEAMQILQMTVDSKLSFREIAQKIGKTANFVALRIKLATNLEPKAMKFMTEQGWPTAWWEQMARLNREAQLEIIKDGWIRSANDLKKHVEKYLRTLGEAKWDVDSIELLPAAGACSACPKRTSAQADLFPDMVSKKNDRCTDPKCWGEKEIAHNTITLQAARKKHGDTIIPVSNGYISRDEQKPWAKDGTKLQAIGYSSGLVEAKKTTEGAVPALIVETGKVVYVASAKAVEDEAMGRKSKGKGKGPKAKAVKTDKEKYAGLTQRRYFAICKAILSCSRTSYGSKPNTKSPHYVTFPKAYGLKELCCLLNATSPSLHHGGDGTSAARNGIKPTDNALLAEQLFEFGRNDIVSSCFGNRLVSDVKVEIIQANIEWFKMDSKALQTWAITEVPTPKSLKDYEAKAAK